MGLGQVMGGPVVLRHGTADQQRRFVVPLAAGTESWCQFFSEPEAGSDLAGQRTSAERDGDEWVVSGQKVWTSGARHADRGMLVARTNWDVPKHRGLSYFVIDVHQPGIEIRPLRQMNGAAHFNEVFFDEARVPHANLIGGEGDGWSVAVSTLAFERSGLSFRVGALTSATPGARGGMLDRPAGDVAASSGRNPDREEAQARAEQWMSARAMRRLAGGRGGSDPVRRQELGRITALSDAIAWTMQRTQGRVRGGGGAPGVEANLAKLGRSDIGRMAQRLGPEVLGPYGMLTADDRPEVAGVAAMVLTVPAQSIAGGSDQVQRNIIGERGLGLPKEPQVDADVPFREVRRSG
jgi:alkylation response protein AidB-like acyl-CoA dehydrogenase